MQGEKKKGILPYIAMTVIFALVIAYTVYHISSIFGEEIITIAAGVSTESTEISGSGYVFRNETLLLSENKGVVDYLARNGEKVHLSQAVANVYEGDGQLGGKDTVMLLDTRIALLEKSLPPAGTDMTKLRKELSESYYAISKQLSDGDIKKLSADTDSLLTELNMIRSLIDGEDSAVNEALRKLRATREAIFQSSGNSIKEYTEQSGYFYTFADGYEEAFNASFAASADGDQLYSLIMSPKTSPKDPYCYGKIAASSSWYFAMPLSRSLAEGFEEGVTYSVNIASGTMGTVPMTLEKILKVNSDTEKAVLLFSCNRLPEDGGLERCLSVSVVTDSSSGIYVPDSAIEMSGGQLGVYVLKGSVVKFRAIEVIYSGNDYCLVASSPSEESKKFDYLAPNELIIVNGKNLFDGRIMD